MKDIFYGRQCIDSDDIQSVLNILSSDFLTQGPWVKRFETSISEVVGSNHCIAVSSATAALHIAAMSLGLKSGDRAWTVANTFVATANTLKLCGAEISFVDISIKHFCIDTESLEKKLKAAELIGELPKLVTVVHFGGNPCDMKTISALSKKYKFRIIEDASHAFGARYSCGSAVGSCKYADVTVFSFHPVKIITTGEGGCLTTNNSLIYNQANLLRSHGIVRNIEEENNVRSEPWMYDQQVLGYNYRLSDIHAALGCSQLKKLDSFIKARNDIANFYDNVIEGLPLRRQFIEPGTRSSFHLYVVLTESASVRRSLYDYMRAHRVFLQVHYIPIYKFEYWAGLLNGQKISCPQTDEYYASAISLPIHPSLTQDELGRIAQLLRAFFGQA